VRHRIWHDEAMSASSSREREPADLPAKVIRASFATEQAVYGVILVSGMIVVAGMHRATSLQVLLTVVVTVLVFWIAHVYAGTVAHHGLYEHRERSLGDAFRMAVERSWGLLGSALIPCVILLLGTTRVVPDDVAIWSALWAGTVVLGVLGYVAFTRRGAPIVGRIIGALSTAAFGLVMVVLKAVVH
jgi:hypothetical protein